MNADKLKAPREARNRGIIRYNKSNLVSQILNLSPFLSSEK